MYVGFFKIKYFSILYFVKKKDLRDTDLLTVRKAVTTLEDLVINPEKLMDMINLQIPEE